MYSFSQLPFSDRIKSNSVGTLSMRVMRVIWIALWENSTLLLTSLFVPFRQPLVDSGIFSVFKHVLSGGCDCH